jgi:hypothetical protein
MAPLIDIHGDGGISIIEQTQMIAMFPAKSKSRQII